MDVWTAVYIIHLLICLISEDNQYYEKLHLRRSVSYNQMMRRLSFSVLVAVMVARYALVLILQRGLFTLDATWAIWLGLRFDPSVYPGMNFPKFFAFDFAIILVSFFYLRQILTSSLMSCVKSLEPSEARPFLLVEYVAFAAALMSGSKHSEINRSRFSFFAIYRQFGLNYDRISAFVGLGVLTFYTVRGFPSLPNLIITFLITLILAQFEPISNSNKFKRELACACVLLRVKSPACVQGISGCGSTFLSSWRCLCLLSCSRP